MKNAIIILICLGLIMLTLAGNVFLNSANGLKKLEKISEIKAVFSDKEDGYFWKISDICCDDEDNLYVADMGWNAIIKLSSTGKYLSTIGRQGQGPGEFLTGKGTGRLKISFGRNKKIYVTDPGLGRISIFDKNGIFVNSTAAPRQVYDKAIVDSTSRLFLINENRLSEKTICIYSPEFRLINCFFDRKDHFDFPYVRPKLETKLELMIDDLQLQKHVASNDRLVVVSNCSLSAYLYDKNQKMIKSFRIDNNRFSEDFKERLRKTLSRAEEAFIFPFDSIVDANNRLYLFYFNAQDDGQEVYQYEIETGKLIDTYLFPEKVRRLSCSTNNGHLVCISGDDGVQIFRINQ